MDEEEGGGEDRGLVVTAAGAACATAGAACTTAGAGVGDVCVTGVPVAGGGDPMREPGAFCALFGVTLGESAEFSEL